MNRRKWLRAVLIGGVLLLAASFGFSRALRTRASRRYLIAHLTVSFGRPVDVSWFDFSLLDGARIEAHFVSVSDDPHFGNEYFLRAETLKAGLRWTALLAGRFEFGSVSLLRPSLNLTRDAEGHWNIERWLPPTTQPGARPDFVGPLTHAGDVRATRPYRIDVQGGRINFKQGDSKSPFALDDVSGRVEQNGEGRWQLDLEARPMRAGVELQDIGTLSLRGSIAGTTARLQPAELILSWRAASLADALRLVSQNDYGMRGQLSVDLNAHIAPQELSSIHVMDSGGALWSITAVARLTGIHGWRLPERDTDPAANFSMQMNWRLGEARAEIPKLLLEMPASRLQGDGDLDWTHGLRPQLHIESSFLGLGDVLSWYRALHPDVAEDLRVDCDLGLDLKLGGWPIEIQNGAIASGGGTLTWKSLPAPLQIGAINASVSRGGIDFAPTEISFAAAPSEPRTEGVLQTDSGPRNSFVMRGSVFPQTSGVFRWPPDWAFTLDGATPRVQDWLALSGALAQPINRSGWTAAGGLAVRMRGIHRAESPAVPWIGTMDFLGLSLSPAYINQPLRLARAHVEFAPSQRTVTLSAAEAFGAVWHGSIARKYSDQQWIFDLAADHLDAAELDRWLGPRARPGFLARFTSSNSAATFATAVADAVATRLAARGRLRAGSIIIPPMRLEQFDSEAELAGRTVRIRKAQADFFGGKISGSLDAQLLPDPSYEFQGRFDRVDLAQLGRAVPFLDSRIAGNASATLTMSTHGVGRQDLVAFMQGQGTLNGRNVELRGSSLSAAFPGDNPDTAPDLFASIQGMYRIQSKRIDLANFMMENFRGQLEAEGQIDFSHALNIRVHPSIFQAATTPASASPPSYLLSGTIEAPKLVLPAAVPKPAARFNPR
jgi:AsmA-like C-terminal region